MIAKLRKALKIRALRADIRALSQRPKILRDEANTLQFDVLPQLKRELALLEGPKVKPVGLTEPAALHAIRRNGF